MKKDEHEREQKQLELERSESKVAENQESNEAITQTSWEENDLHNKLRVIQETIAVQRLSVEQLTEKIPKEVTPIPQPQPEVAPSREVLFSNQAKLCYDRFAPKEMKGEVYAFEKLKRQALEDELLDIQREIKLHSENKLEAQERVNACLNHIILVQMSLQSEEHPITKEKANDELKRLQKIVEWYGDPQLKYHVDQIVALACAVVNIMKNLNIENPPQQVQENATTLQNYIDLCCDRILQIIISNADEKLKTIAKNELLSLQKITIQDQAINTRIQEWNLARYQKEIKSSKSLNDALNQLEKQIANLKKNLPNQTKIPELQGALYQPANQLLTELREKKNKIDSMKEKDKQKIITLVDAAAQCVVNPYSSANLQKYEQCIEQAGQTSLGRTPWHKTKLGGLLLGFGLVVGGIILVALPVPEPTTKVLGLCMIGIGTAATFGTSCSFLQQNTLFKRTEQLRRTVHAATNDEAVKKIRGNNQP